MDAPGLTRERLRADGVLAVAGEGAVVCRVLAVLRRDVQSRYDYRTADDDCALGAVVVAADVRDLELNRLCAFVDVHQRVERLTCNSRSDGVATANESIGADVERDARRFLNLPIAGRVLGRRVLQRERDVEGEGLGRRDDLCRGRGVVRTEEEADDFIVNAICFCVNNYF